MFPKVPQLNNPGTISEIQPYSDLVVSNDFVTPLSVSTKKNETVRNLAILVLVVSLMLASLAFAYTLLLSSQVAKLKDNLLSYDTEPGILFLSDNLLDIKNLSQRLKLLKEIRERHIYVSQMLFPILESLAESEKKSYVYFNRFAVQNEKGNTPLVSLSGVSLDYATLIRQLRNFKSQNYQDFIKNFKLNNLSLDQNGNVLFDVSFVANISGEKWELYRNITAANSLETDSKIGIQPGPLFKATPEAASTIPVEAQIISDELEGATTTLEAGTALPLSTSTNSTSSSRDASN